MTQSFTLVIIFSTLFWFLNKNFKTPRRNSPQTFHKKSTSRMGGVAAMLALVVHVFFASRPDIFHPVLSKVILCSIPIFAAGFLDDLGLNVKPWQRIIIMLPSPILHFSYAEIQVTSVGIDFFDYILSFEIAALLFLIFAIVGIANAFNIIDGFNGLLLSYCFGIALSILFNNQFVATAYEYTLDLMAVILGLLLFNFFGKIFMGDAGAYMLGIIISSGVIVLQQNNDYSPWYVFLIFIYPVTEVLTSIIRKVFIRNRSAMEPDGLHFHMLIYKRLSKKIGFRRLRLRHFLVTLTLFILNMPFLIAANLFASEQNILIFLCGWYILVYLMIYFILLPKYIFKSK